MYGPLDMITLAGQLNANDTLNGVSFIANCVSWVIVQQELPQLKTLKVIIIRQGAGYIA